MGVCSPVQCASASGGTYLMHFESVALRMDVAMASNCIQHTHEHINTNVFILLKEAMKSSKGCVPSKNTMERERSETKEEVCAVE